MAASKDLIKNSSWSPFHFFDRNSDQGDFAPKIEVRDEGDRYLLYAELPGVNEEDIDITLSDNTLILEGEKKQERKEEREGFYRTEFSYGSFYRSIPLGSDVESESVKATYSDGVLEVTMDKKKDAGSSSRKISIGKVQ